MKVIKRIKFKSYNRRQVLDIIQLDNGEINFVIFTRKLVDFKTREIANFEMFLSPLSFLLVQDLINMAISDDVLIKNLILDDIILCKNIKVDCKEQKNPNFYK